MAKRVRDFRRINLTAKIAQFIRESLVDKTFNDHFKKCLDLADVGEICHHQVSRSLDVARLVESGISVGKKRGYLDLACPYSLLDPKEHIAVLDVMAERLRGFAEKIGNDRTKATVIRVCEEIDAYAHRNAMEVVAEAAI